MPAFMHLMAFHLAWFMRRANCFWLRPCLDFLKSLLWSQTDFLITHLAKALKSLGKQALSSFLETRPPLEASHIFQAMDIFMAGFLQTLLVQHLKRLPTLLQDLRSMHF